MMPDMMIDVEKPVTDPGASQAIFGSDIRSGLSGILEHRLLYLYEILSGLAGYPYSWIAEK